LGDRTEAVVESYTDGFRKGDLVRILSCLTDDVVWALHAAKTLVSQLDTSHIWLGEVPTA
jgi:hypothetical protein